MTDSQKEAWKKEADQIKKDLANRPKEIRRREVEIRVAKPGENRRPTAPKPKADASLDDRLRRQLGLG